ncbi:MAG: lipoprotein [Piscinibacter sp.]|nr:lipoprotein [Piscinibacter sp.]
MLQRHISVVLLGAALALSACGQKGPLTLPKPLPSSSAASAPAR